MMETESVEGVNSPKTKRNRIVQLLNTLNYAIMSSDTRLRWAVSDTLSEEIRTDITKEDDTKVWALKAECIRINNLINNLNNQRSYNSINKDVHISKHNASLLKTLSDMEVILRRYSEAYEKGGRRIG